MKRKQQTHSQHAGYPVAAYTATAHTTANAQDRKALMLFALVGLSVIMLFGVKFCSENQPPKFCEAALPQNAHSLVFIDDSDPLSLAVIGVIKDRITGIVDHMQAGDWLSIVTLQHVGGDNITRTYLQVCKPRQGHEVNVITENGKIADKQYQKNFVVVLDKALEQLRQLAGKDPAATSPLIRAMYEIAQMPSFAEAIPHRELLIVSDMLENSPMTCSFFTNKACRIDVLENTVYVQSVKDKLADKIAIIALKNQNQKYQKKADFNPFWDAYLKFAGLEEENIDRQEIIVKADANTRKGWVIEVGTYNNARQAKQLIKRLTARGLTAFNAKKDRAYIVFVGPEKCQRSAEVLNELVIRRELKLKNSRVVAL